MFNRTRVRSPILVHMNTVNPIPAGYRAITPYLAVPDGHAALDYYKRALGAEIVDAMNAPDGSLMHAEIRIGDSMLQLSQEMPDFGLKSPQDGWGAFVNRRLHRGHGRVCRSGSHRGRHAGHGCGRYIFGRPAWSVSRSVRPQVGSMHEGRGCTCRRGSLAGRGRSSFRRRSRHSNLWQPWSEHSSFGGVLSIRLLGPRGQPAPHPSRSGSRSWRRDPRRRRGERLADWNRGV